MEDARRRKLTGVVLDDDPRWCNLIVGVLARLEIAVIGTVPMSASALGLVEQLRPDLFVADAKLALFDVEGVACLVRGLELHDDMRAVVLSDDEDPVEIVRSFRAGAHAYVLKSAKREEIAAAIRQVFSRSVFFPSTRSGLANAASAQARARQLLTRRELEILEFAAAGVPNAQIARELWLSNQTVKFHLTNLYKKIGVSNRTEASRWAYEHGVLGAARIRARE